MIGLGLVSGKNEWIGRGGESLFVAACPQSCGLDALGGIGMEESKGGE